MDLLFSENAQLHFTTREKIKGKRRMETLSPISIRISLLLRKSHKRPHLSVGYFTKKKGVCQGLFLAGHSPPFFLPGTVPRPGSFVSILQASGEPSRGRPGVLKHKSGFSQVIRILWDKP